MNKVEVGEEDLYAALVVLQMNGSHFYLTNQAAKRLVDALSPRFQQCLRDWDDQ